MPSKYTGNEANVSNTLSATITGVGAGPNSQVTTSAPHGMFTGDIVYISGVVGTGAFATWVNNVPPYGWSITVTGSNLFTIPNGTTSGAYSSGGSAVDSSLTPATTIPEAGDSFTAPSYNVPIQTALDRTQFLAQQIQNIKALNSVTAGFTFTASSVSSTILAVTNNGPPCELQTSAAHRLQTGMWVNITGATGDTAINGNWQVTVVDSTHFEIPTTGSGSYAVSSATASLIIPAGVNWMIVDGWGGGGGGEGGGGGNLIADQTPAFNGSPVQGGGGSGAPRTTVALPVVPLSALSVTIGAGGLGGLPGVAAPSYAPANAGSNGDLSSVTVGATTVRCPAGLGAGAGTSTTGGPGQPFIGTVPNTYATIAPGASQRSNAQNNKPWGFAAAWQFNNTPPIGGSTPSVGANTANFIAQDAGAGGAAVLPFVAGPFPETSTRGIGQAGDPSGGALPGTSGANHGSSPVLLGGAGGGGGGSGPAGGAGGVGGNGTDAHAGGSNPGGAAFQGGLGSTQSNAPNTTNTGAGGGGGGTAGAATLPANVGLGGPGGGGDSGQVSISFIQAGP